MKVVIAKHGGFWISREAWLRLLELGFDPMVAYPDDMFPDKFSFDNTHWLDEEQLKVYTDEVEYHRKYCEERWKEGKSHLSYGYPYPSFNDYLYRGGCNYGVTIPRNHPLLLQVVEELGIMVNAPAEFAEKEDGTLFRDDNLGIIEIPDDMEWYIDESESGGEFVREKHRVFG